jgi:hypothetical protein
VTEISHFWNSSDGPLGGDWNRKLQVQSGSTTSWSPCMRDEDRSSVAETVGLDRCPPVARAGSRVTRVEAAAVMFLIHRATRVTRRVRGFANLCVVVGSVEPNTPFPGCSGGKERSKNCKGALAVLILC